jgi:thioester reductase-like protein
MDRRGGILLTGATGFLGRYLLRDLLATGTRVAVLVRPGRTQSAEERVREALEFACETQGRRVPAPTLFVGDLREPKLGLSGMDRNRLARNCGSVVHAAASLSFRRTADGEPHRTNTTASRRLFELCSEWEIRAVHHISTAFVCGDQAGPVLESDTDRGQQFHNDYERSKLAAELAAREASALRVTLYRPSVIVGDYRTGHTTSYHGLYRFLELANRLAQPGGQPGRRWLPLRLPFGGDEPRDLVPVDWVSAAITRIVGRPAFHGRTFHLTSARPTPVSAIKDVATEELGLDGVQLTRTVPDPSQLERMFLAGLRDYWSYLGGDPVFDRRNVRDALPDLPPPRVDHECLRRLVRFAVADGWGGRRRRPDRSCVLDCGDYIERFFPEALGRSPIARIAIETTLSFDIRGAGGGRWVCRLGGGRVLRVARHSTERADVEYRMAVPTFAALVSGRESPQAAFVGRRIEIAGSVEKGLKLAVLFGQFVRAFPYPVTAPTEDKHDAALRS